MREENVVVTLCCSPRNPCDSDSLGPRDSSAADELTLTTRLSPLSARSDESGVADDRQGDSMTFAAPSAATKSRGGGAAIRGIRENAMIEGLIYALVVCIHDRYGLTTMRAREETAPAEKARPDNEQQGGEVDDYAALDRV
jgi:hypothetical protein